LGSRIASTKQTCPKLSGLLVGSAMVHIETMSFSNFSKRSSKRDRRSRTINDLWVKSESKWCEEANPFGLDPTLNDVWTQMETKWCEESNPFGLDAQKFGPVALDRSQSAGEMGRDRRQPEKHKNTPPLADVIQSAKDLISNCDSMITSLKKEQNVSTQQVKHAIDQIGADLHVGFGVWRPSGPGADVQASSAMPPCRTSKLHTNLHCDPNAHSRLVQGPKAARRPLRSASAKIVSRVACTVEGSEQASFAPSVSVGPASKKGGMLPTRSADSFRVISKTGPACYSTSLKTVRTPPHNWRLGWSSQLLEATNPPLGLTPMRAQIHERPLSTLR